MGRSTDRNLRNRRRKQSIRKKLRQQRKQQKKSRSLLRGQHPVALQFRDQPGAA
jgi:hypothetical protein